MRRLSLCGAEYTVPKGLFNSKIGPKNRRPVMAAKKVLFLCTGNTSRSQMAEAFLRKHGGVRFEVHSAGLAPGEEIHPLTRRVMSEVGLDLSGQHPKSLRPYLGRFPFDVVIFVCEKAEKTCPAMWPTVVTGVSWPFEDPAAFSGDEEQQIAKFRAVRDLIEKKILEWLG